MGRTIEISPAQARSARRLQELAEKWGQPVSPKVRAMASAGSAESKSSTAGSMDSSRSPSDAHFESSINEQRRLGYQEARSVEALFPFAPSPAGRSQTGRTPAEAAAAALHNRNIRAEVQRLIQESSTVDPDSPERQAELDEFMASLQRAIRFLSADDVAGSGATETGPASLTEREMAVLRFLGAGASRSSIARDLFLSTSTVDSHIQRIAQKIGRERFSQLRENDTTLPS